MAKRKYSVDVVTTYRVEIDDEKIDADFWREFSETITDTGGPDLDYLVEHIAWNVSRGEWRFVEGVGDLKEMNITCDESDCEVTALEVSG
jgi:hypothetical protein